MPKLSVVIPAYNAEDFIAETIQSVLSQSFNDFEMIVVDDGSNDRTASIVRNILDPRVRYLYQHNQGMTAARNYGISQSQGEYFLFLDADDLYLPDKLGLQVDYLNTHPATGLVASGYQYINAGGEIIGEVKPWIHQEEITLLDLLKGGLTPPHAVMIRKHWLEKVGNFDAVMTSAGDMDLWYRLYLHGCPMEWLREVVCQYRIHHSNATHDILTHLEFSILAMDRVFNDSRVPVDVLREKLLALRGPRKMIFVDQQHLNN
jgi:glycosyltransferase involved in cell wall biosynthesis